MAQGWIATASTGHHVDVCGRTYLIHPRSALRAFFRLGSGGILEALEPRYSFLPGELLPLVVQADDEPSLEASRWGIQLGRGAAPRPINLRAETALARASVRQVLAHQRCILPVTGFYEPEGPKRKGRPQWVFRARGGEPLALAGVWRTIAGAEPTRSFAVFTTRPNGVVGAVHDRMPAVLDSARIPDWLDPAQTDAHAVASMLRACPDARLEGYRVVDGTYRCAADDPECIRPHPGDAQRSLF